MTFSVTKISGHPEEVSQEPWSRTAVDHQKQKCAPLGTHQASDKTLAIMGHSNRVHNQNVRDPNGRRVYPFEQNGSTLKNIYHKIRKEDFWENVIVGRIMLYLSFITIRSCQVTTVLVSGGSQSIQDWITQESGTLDACGQPKGSQCTIEYISGIWWPTKHPLLLPLEATHQNGQGYKRSAKAKETVISFHVKKKGF